MRIRVDAWALLMICSADDGCGEPDTQATELAPIGSSVNAKPALIMWLGHTYSDLCVSQATQ